MIIISREKNINNKTNKQQQQQQKKDNCFIEIC